MKKPTMKKLQADAKAAGVDWNLVMQLVAFVIELLKRRKL